MTNSGTPETTAAAAQQTAVLLAAFEAMEGTLSVAEALAASKRRIDLSGLEDEMGRLCVAALAAPAEALPAIRMRLEGLLRAVDRLQASLPRP